MSNTEASDENVKSPSTYGNEAYQHYRKKEKKKNTANPKKEGHNSDMSYTKYAVGGEAKEVPASPESGENDNFVLRRQKNKPKERNSRRNQ